MPNSEPSQYSYKVKAQLSLNQRAELREKYVPLLFSLGRRYLPEFDFSKGAPLRYEFLDVIRTGWLLDKNTDRPDYADIVWAVGYAFGLLLEDKFGMTWCLIEDHMGESISMIKFQSNPDSTYKEVSIAPFNYVAKRKELQNAEVFADGMREFEKIIAK